jgi:hypothetical protein
MRLIAFWPCWRASGAGPPNKQLLQTRVSHRDSQAALLVGQQTGRAVESRIVRKYVQPPGSGWEAAAGGGMELVNR